MNHINGAFFSSTTYEYNSDDNLVQKTYKTEDSVTISEYNASGQEIKRNTYNLDGTFSHGYTYEFDSDGKLIVQNSKAEDGSAKDYDLYEYNENGKKARSSRYKSDGTIMSRSDYDDQEREILFVYYQGGIKTIEHHYRYPETGKRLEKKIFYNTDGTIRSESDWQ